MTNRKEVKVPIEDAYYPVNQEFLQMLYLSRKRNMDIIFVGEPTQEIDFRIKQLMKLGVVK